MLEIVNDMHVFHLTLRLTVPMIFPEYLTIIPWALVGYAMVNIANEARSAELAMISLISKARSWNNCFIKFFKLQKFGSTKYERKKGENPSEIEKT